MVDRIFATISMLGVIVFMGIVTVGVMEPSLWIITLIVVAIGIRDFVASLRDSANKNAGS